MNAEILKQVAKIEKIICHSPYVHEAITELRAKDTATFLQRLSKDLDQIMVAVDTIREALPPKEPEEGDDCPEKGCGGTMEFPPRPACRDCAKKLHPLTCNVCGWAKE